LLDSPCKQGNRFQQLWNKWLQSIDVVNLFGKSSGPFDWIDNLLSQEIFHRFYQGPILEQLLALDLLNR
jgi:hypothetical protein